MNIAYWYKISMIFSDIQYTWTCIVFICTYAACLELQITAQVRDFMEQIKL